MTLDELEARIIARAKADPAHSYTAALVQAGMPRAGKKLGEEAIETVIAALSGDRREIAKESADLLYHLIVALHMAGVRVQDVMEELDRRTTQSGFEEKASRAPGGV